MAREQTLHSNQYYDGAEHSISPGEAIRTTLLNRISWGAVFAGLAIAFAVQLVLNLLGVGIGFTSLESLDATAAAYEFSWTTAIWWTISGIIAAYIGGFSAGRLSGEPKFTTAAWHGLTTWALSVMVITALMASAGAAAINMGSPYQVVLDQQTATMTTGDTAPYSPGTTATARDQTATATIDTGTLAAASLMSAIALILGAIAAWFGGRAGTVSTPVKNDRQQSYAR